MLTAALRATLDLSMGNDVLHVPGGNVKRASLALHPWGFEAEVSFWSTHEAGTDDPFLAPLSGPGLVEARLGLLRVHDLPSPEPKPLAVTGLVTRKVLQETAYHRVRGAPVLQRLYTLTFRDAARVLWGQHYPAALYVDATMAEVLMGHTAKGVVLQMDWPLLLLPHPVICLGLGVDGHEASFYDYVHWFVASNGGVLTYKHSRPAYRFALAKATDGRATVLRPTDVARVAVVQPEVQRHDLEVLNASTLATEKRTTLPNPFGVGGVHADVLVREPIAADHDVRVVQEAFSLIAPGRQLELSFATFPARPFSPGARMLFSPEFGLGRSWLGSEYRVVELRVAAETTAQGPNDDHDVPSAIYQVDLSARLELMDDPFVHRPPYVTPRWPIRVEGTVVSDAGEPTHKTYQVGTDEATSQEYYTVKVPLWNKDVRVPFEPDHVTGHAYFPAYKNQRVLLAVDHDRAVIERFLGRGARVALPQDSQGNHLLLGKSASSETSVRHVYADEKPALTVLRIQEKDTERISMSEGTLLLEVKEDESAAGTEEAFDVTPNVDLARFELSMGTAEGLGSVQSDFESTSSSVKDKIDDAVDKVAERLEDLDRTVRGKADEIDGKVTAAMAELTQATSKLVAAAESAKDEFRQKLRL